ncbi:GntR family transcriptional regulator [Devosia sp. Root635]|uniref:GntR family transcriptional regulator n=1 Tax=Devosia sp. Root635 TaxID=1736575 RepID=UPI0006F78E38|nr:GntR family transcriptional regulator [Devosia sp. Root635]KRA47720.1 GntR family transcriptional regulator [Devosia sp. Root635]
MKSDTVYKAAFNAMLDLLAASSIGMALPPENDLSRVLNVSRTTVRKVVVEMAARGFLAGEGRSRIIASMPPGSARFSDAETTSTSDQVERQFMEWMLRGDAKPGTLINELELARVFGVATTGIREFLNRFQRFGLIEKRPNAGWLFKGFTEDFAIELFEIREMFETRSALALAELSPSAPVWARLRAIEREHHDLLGAIDDRFHDFSDLDNRFHRMVNSAVPNRFIDDFYDVITFIFHYHYQWNKRDERRRNEIAISEHLAYIAALFSRDRDQVKAVCNRHLTSARATMLRSFGR